MHDRGGVAAVLKGSAFGMRRSAIANEASVGTLILDGNKIRFNSPVTGETFDRPVNTIEEVRLNRFGIEGHRAFHIRFNDGENYNFIATGNPDEIVRSIQSALAR
jgi:hypothetical protein